MRKRNFYIRMTRRRDRKGLQVIGGVGEVGAVEGGGELMEVAPRASIIGGDGGGE